jgi:hypothetical protein
VDTKEASNKDDNYHYADDVENVHCELRLRYGDFNMKARRLNRKRPGLTLSSVVQAVDIGDRRDIATRDVPYLKILMAPDSLEFAISDSLVNIALSDKSKAGLAGRFLEPNSQRPIGPCERSDLILYSETP